MRVAILGTGNISKEFMNASRIAEVEVCAVYHREMAKAEAFAENYGIPAYFDDYDEMLKQDFFDTVYTGLPNSLHYPYAKKALCAGKNVLIEKPFCSNLAEFDELVNLSHKHNVYLIEMDRVTSLPNFSVIRDHLGELGPIRAVTIDYAQYSRKYDDY
ncbi:MAG: Gfo/Idh/MocA family oxidoreductase, partial [Erysipelotrichaceae bacterium]|nr:Gfo/Idh/MocA family oxidoreductase [Erysipelotrichaceae bacterium]